MSRATLSLYKPYADEENNREVKKFVKEIESGGGGGKKCGKIRRGG